MADIITAKETVKGKATNYSFQNDTRKADRLSVASDSAAYSNTINAPHEYFDLRR